MTAGSPSNRAGETVALLIDVPISSAAFWWPGTAMFVRLKLSENGSREASATPCTPGSAWTLPRDLAPVLLAAFGRVAQHAGIRRHDRKPGCREADVCSLRGEEAPDQQSCRHQQHDRDRHLPDDEQIAPRPAAAPAARDVSLQVPDQVGARGAKRRREARQDAREKRDTGGEAQDAGIQPEIERQRDRNRQIERAEQSREPRGEQHADTGAEHAEDEAFRQELADEAPSPGADGEANRDLALTGRRARQQHAGDVRARDDQHETHREHRAGDDPCEHAVRFGVEPRIGGWPDRDPPIFVRLRMLGTKARHDDLHVGARLLDRSVTGQPSLGEQPALPATIDPRRARRRGHALVDAGRLDLLGEADGHPESQARASEPSR